MLTRKQQELSEESEGSKEDPAESRSKRPQQRLILCTQNCRYNVVKRVCRRMDIKPEADEHADWDIYWSDLVVPPERISKL